MKTLAALTIVLSIVALYYGKQAGDAVGAAQERRNAAIVAIVEAGR